MKLKKTTNIFFVSILMFFLIITQTFAQEMWIDTNKLSSEKQLTQPLSFFSFSITSTSDCEGKYYTNYAGICKQKYNCDSSCSVCFSKEVDSSNCNTGTGGTITDTTSFTKVDTTQSATEVRYECMYESGKSVEYVKYEGTGGTVYSCSQGSCYQKSSDTIECKGETITQDVFKCINNEEYVIILGTDGSSLKYSCSSRGYTGKCVQKTNTQIECVNLELTSDECTGATDCLQSGISSSINIWKNCNQYESQQCPTDQICVNTGFFDPNLIGYKCVDKPTVTKLLTGEKEVECKNGDVVLTEKTVTAIVDESDPGIDLDWFDATKGYKITVYSCDKTSYCVPNHGCIVSNEENTFIDKDGDGVFIIGNDCWPDGSRVVSTDDCCSKITYNPNDGGLVICGEKEGYTSITSTVDENGNVFISGSKITPKINLFNPNINSYLIIGIIVMTVGIILFLIWRKK